MNRIKTILAVAPGRHRIGYAVYHQNKLTYYGIASLSGFKTKSEVCQAVEKFSTRVVDRFPIDAVALCKLDKSQKASTLLPEIARHLERLCKKRKIEILRYDKDFINRHFCRNGERPTKDKTALFLVSKYPELKRYYDLRKEWLERYYAYLFRAIALGSVCLAEIEAKTKRKRVLNPNV